MMENKNLKAFLLACLLTFLFACGGSSGSNKSSTSTPGQAQGVYVGTDSNNDMFATIVLPNDQVYAIYSCCTTTTGLLVGQGTSNNGTYTATVTDFSTSGMGTATASITATYVAGTSINGTSTENGKTVSFSGTVPTGFNYNTPAVLSNITGTWTGELGSSLNEATTATLTINSNGSFSGSDVGGCTFSGMIIPDGSGKNFFDVSITYGGSPCNPAKFSVSGAVAVSYGSSNGVNSNLDIAGSSGANGAMFLANR